MRSIETRVRKREEMEARREERRSKTWGTYSLGSSKKILMYRGVFPEVVTFCIDVVRGGEQGETEHENSVAKGRNPHWAHPGGYSRRDAMS